MEKSQAKRIYKNLINAGYGAKIDMLTNNRSVVVVDSGYTGPYPPARSFEILEDMRKKYKKNFTVEPRGHYSAVFIY